MGVTNSPNLGFRGNNAGHSSQPSAGPSYTDGRIMGSNPGNRFGVGDAKMPQPPSAVAPGQGAVPTQPYNSSGMPNRVEVNIPDVAWIAKPTK